MAFVFVPPRAWTPRQVCEAIGHVWELLYGLVAFCDHCHAVLLLQGG